MDATARNPECRHTVEDAASLLEEAQAILDLNQAPPNVGARLQEVIELVRALESPSP